jgi:hypothetical protein
VSKSELLVAEQVERADFSSADICSAKPPAVPEAVKRHRKPPRGRVLQGFHEPPPKSVTVRIFRVWPRRHEPVSHPKGASRQGRRPGTIPLWVLPDCGIHRRHVHGAGSPHPGGARRSDWRGQSLACLFPLQRFQGLPDRGRRPEYRRGRPVIQSASPRLARALFLVTERKRDHWPDSSRSRHCGRAPSQPPPTDSTVRKLFAPIARCHQMLGDLAAASNACSEGLRHDPDAAELLFRKAVPTARPASRPRPKPAGGGF